MPSRITCQVHDEPPVTVVRVAGSLDLTTTRQVHRVLQRCLTAQPDALIVDLAGLRIADPLALSVFAAAARQAAEWPAVPVVLCDPPTETAQRLTETTACRTLPVHRNCAEATRLARRSAAPRMWARLEPVAGACRRARELAAQACERWNLPDLVGPVSLVLTELVGNVVRHAGTPMDVTLTLRPPYLHLAVADRCGTAVRPRTPGSHAEGDAG
ncbi:STAS domain-containing protein [Micromonospora sp. CPCC 206060]|uniref:STAS domain-containing protein n=1 Tax=Micromonospora sp. CPCC 206060 TaxID=3122406 RepID=UPI002FF15303